MKQVIVYPRGQLSTKDRKALRDAGIIAIEADDPSKVVTVIPFSPISGADDLLMSAMAGITCDSLKNKHSAFVGELHKRLIDKERKRTGKAEPGPTNDN